MTNLFDFEAEKERIRTGIKERSIVYQMNYSQLAGGRDLEKEYSEESCDTQNRPKKLLRPTSQNHPTRIPTHALLSFGSYKC